MKRTQQQNKNKKNRVKFNQNNKQYETNEKKMKRTRTKQKFIYKLFSYYYLSFDGRRPQKNRGNLKNSSFSLHSNLEEFKTRTNKTERERDCAFIDDRQKS